MREDHGIASLLDLHDQIIDLDGGCWVKIEAWRVEVTEHVPHGIRYSLTLHEPYGKRILGYDNAHAVKLPKKFKYAGQHLTYVLLESLIHLVTTQLNRRGKGVPEPTDAAGVVSVLNTAIWVRGPTVRSMTLRHFTY